MFVRTSIDEVVRGYDIEAILAVGILIYLFLGNLRATIIPTFASFQYQ
ncbi:MAG: efflux RND transporter permease subunit [Gammaproteobacteria bacterium]|nr:efflux RND transporter permease subunit [Gammaproteobacteria bacterium]